MRRRAGRKWRANEVGFDVEHGAVVKGVGERGRTSPARGATTGAPHQLWV